MLHNIKSCWYTQTWCSYKCINSVKWEPGVFDHRPQVLQAQMVQKELLDELQQRLTAAEQALVAKQDKIDLMKQEIFQKEKELEQISVFQAQVSGRINAFTFVLRSWCHKSTRQHGYPSRFLLYFLCRQRSTPRTSTQSEQRGRSSMRRGSVWLLSWSMWRSRTSICRRRWTHWAGTELIRRPSLVLVMWFSSVCLHPRKKWSILFPLSSGLIKEL